jgi:DNA-binding NarL/FixJ family response regulator
MQPTNAQRSPTSSLRVLISIRPGFLQDSIRAILASFSYIQVIETGPGKDFCLEEVCQLHPQVILLDCAAANPGWGEFLHEVRRRQPDIACLALTHTSVTAHQALEQGAVESLSTGFTSLELALAIQRAAHSICQADLLPKDVKA